MYPFLDIATFVIGIFDEVLRAGKSNCAIHNNDFAVVA
jgi:hypothetical protein